MKGLLCSSNLSNLTRIRLIGKCAQNVYLPLLGRKKQRMMIHDFVRGANHKKGEDMDEKFTNRKHAYSEPEWLIDAWQAAINNYQMRSRDYLINEIKHRLETGRPSSGTWDFWNLASMLAILGWKEVQGATESDGETDGEETGDQSAGE